MVKLRFTNHLPYFWWYLYTSPQETIKRNIGKISSPLFMTSISKVDKDIPFSYFQFHGSMTDCDCDTYLLTEYNLLWAALIYFMMANKHHHKLTLSPLHWTESYLSNESFHEQEDSSWADIAVVLVSILYPVPED